MRALIIILFFIINSDVSAQIYQVRSGEHADFSRIVILFPQTPEWDFGRVDGGYELRISQVSARYNTSSVFDLIPRKRIINLEERPGARLFLNVICECYPNVFEISAGLVIDINDGRSDDENPYDTKLNDDFFDMNFILETNTRAEAVTETEIFENNALFTTETLKDYAPNSYNLFQISDTNDDINVASIASQINSIGSILSPEIFGQISIAVSQGFINPVLSDLSNGFIDQNPPPDVQSQDLLEEHIDNFSNSDHIKNHGINLRVGTAVERTKMNLMLSHEPPYHDVECVDSNFFDVKKWGLYKYDMDSLADSKPKLVDELNEINYTNLTNIAKNYIYHSFGAEARRIIENSPNISDQSKYLLLLSDIVDGKEVPKDIEFKNQIYCDNIGAVWSAIAYPFDLNDYNQLVSNTIISSFSNFPQHLRILFGYRLVDRFLGVGDLESARKIRSQTARTFGNLNNAYLIINTAIFLKTDVSKIDIEKLYKLSLSNNALSYEAMIKLIEALIAREQEIDDNILDALEKMAFETQNSQTGFNIQVAQINALFVTGRIAKAMDIFDELRVISNVSPSVFQFIFDHIVTLSLRQKNDAIFLNFILNFSEKMIIEDEDLNFKIATRLVDLGLYQNARKFISQSNGKYSQEQRILLGKSYVMNGQGNLAIEHLQGVTDSEANFLLARAYEQVGDFSKAASSLLELGDVQGQRRLALQARNWEALADIGSEEQSSAASFFLKENELDNSISNNLNGDEFLKRSKQAREIIQNLIK